MKTTYEPIEALFAKDAESLIGHRVLCAQDRKGLGYYATLVRIEGGSRPFVCILENHLNEKKRSESNWSCICKDNMYN